MAIRHYRLVRNHLGSDRKECLQRNLRRDILYKKKKKERKKEESRSLGKRRRWHRRLDFSMILRPLLKQDISSIKPVPRGLLASPPLFKQLCGLLLNPLLKCTMDKTTMR